MDGTKSATCRVQAPAAATLPPSRTQAPEEQADPQHAPRRSRRPGQRHRTEPCSLPAEQRRHEARARATGLDPAPATTQTSATGRSAEGRRNADQPSWERRPPGYETCSSPQPSDPHLLEELRQPSENRSAPHHDRTAPTAWYSSKSEALRKTKRTSSRFENSISSSTTALTAHSRVERCCGNRARRRP